MDVTEVGDPEAMAGERSVEIEAAVLGAGVARAGVDLRLLVSRAIKRGVDIVAAAALLIVLSPVLLALAILVRLDSPGPVFFRCERVGYRGRRLRMLKFRKMVHDAAGAPLTSAGDERFTRLGRRLAKFKLDELPQLWHVLIGEMSLVGPRPESAQFVEHHAGAYHERITTVRPGVFGLSQLAFACEGEVLEQDDPVGHYVRRILPQKVALDVMYVQRRSLALDVRVLFWSFFTVVFRRPIAVDRESAAMRRRYR